jgi:hypothetical protein
MRPCQFSSSRFFLHDERDRRAERLAAPHAARELDAIGLDLHATAATVPALAPREVGVDVLRE